VRELPLPDPAFWIDLERLIVDVEAQPHWHYLPRQLTRPKAIPRPQGVGVHGAAVPGDSRWASTGCTTGGTRCLERAGSSPQA
jgi:hypothetical protein